MSLRSRLRRQGIDADRGAKLLVRHARRRVQVTIIGRDGSDDVGPRQGAVHPVVTAHMDEMSCARLIARLSEVLAYLQRDKANA